MLSLDTHVKDLLPDPVLQGDDLQVEPLREDYDTPGLISVTEKKKSELIESFLKIQIIDSIDRN